MTPRPHASTEPDQAAIAAFPHKCHGSFLTMKWAAGQPHTPTCHDTENKLVTTLRCSQEHESHFSGLFSPTHPCFPSLLRSFLGNNKLACCYCSWPSLQTQQIQTSACLDPFNFRFYFFTLERKKAPAEFLTHAKFSQDFFFPNFHQPFKKGNREAKHSFPCTCLSPLLRNSWMKIHLAGREVSFLVLTKPR